MTTIDTASIKAGVNSAAEDLRRIEVRNIVAGVAEGACDAPILDTAGGTVCHVRAKAIAPRALVTLYAYEKRDAAIAAAAEFFGRPVRFARTSDIFGDYLKACEVEVG